MSKNKAKPIMQIHLADQQFANGIVGKYGWKIDNAFARSKLQHRVQPKQHNSMTFAKSPVIHLTKVIQPLHIKLIYEHHQLNRIVEYKNASLLVSSTSTSERWSTNTSSSPGTDARASAGTSARTSTDAVRSTTTHRTTTLLEKVIQTAQEQAKRKVLQQLQSQIEHKTIITRSSDIRTPISDTTTEGINSTSVTSSSPWINTSQSIYSINQTANSLHHVQQIEAKQQASNKQVAVAKVMLSPYIRNIVREEQERITAELVERNNRLRTKATLHGLQTIAVRKNEVFTNQVLTNEVLTNAVQRGNSVTQVKRELSHSTTNRQTIINDMKYYLKTKTHYINSIKHHQKLIQNEQKLVYIPFVNRKDAGVNEKVQLIYRNLLTQIDSRITNNQHSYKQQLINNQHLQKHENHNNERLLKQEGNSKLTSPALRKKVTLTGQSIEKIHRRFEATIVQIRSVTSFHQQLIERNERLIYGIEMVEKKKTPRARKLSLVPVVKLSYRVLPEEQRKSSIQIPQTQLAQDLDRRNKDTNSKVSPLLSQVQGVRRQAQLIYTEHRKNERRIDQYTTKQVNEQITKQTIQQVNEQITQQVKVQVNEQLVQRGTEQVTQQVQEQVIDQVKQQVKQPLENQKNVDLRQPSVSAVVATNKGQAISTFSKTIKSIIERPQYHKSLITGQLTHISKVNKTQLQQVKVLQSKLKQIEATTLVVSRTIRTATIDSSNNSKETIISNNIRSKQLVYRQMNSNSVQQLDTLITELQKARIQTIQSASHHVSVVDVPSIIQPLTKISTTINSMATKKINLIHSSQQQSERLTKRLKQLGGATLFSKVKNMISTQTPLSMVQMKQTNEQDVNLLVNEQHHKSKSQIVEQVKLHTQSSMNLHVAKQQNMQQEDSKQLNAMKQLEVTVKRLEQEISVAKEATIQPNINMRQLSDQLFDQIAKKIRLEKHRVGR